MKSKKEKKQRMRGDNLILCILIVILIAIALLVGVSYGYELGIKNCNKHYSAFIQNNCMCFIPANQYETERFIPIDVLNISVYDS